jgi:uncharacterized protein involved in response to NO
MMTERHDDAASMQYWWPPLFNLGFRPFFFGASLFAVASVAAWTAIYQFGWSLDLAGITPYQWHAHEMVYGYGLAVIAGFLLTAVRNWTDLPTAHGPALAALFVCWGGARLAYFGGTRFIAAAALLDGLFTVGLIVAVGIPIFRSRQWERMAVLSKLVLLGGGNVLFYLGYWQVVGQGAYWSVYGGLYLVVGLILTLGRQLVPFFIERDAGLSDELPNHRWVDLGSMVLFLVFFASELFFLGPWWTGVSSIGLFVLSLIRLYGWYNGRIWANPLLWSLYLSYGCISLGFLLFALSAWGLVMRFVAVHAFAFGGIGIITMGMMARVSLGHTGRDVKQVPKAVGLALGLLVVGLVCRVGAPLLAPEHYVVWVGAAQGLWIAAFLLFAATYAPMWLKYSLENRID